MTLRCRFPHAFCLLVLLIGGGVAGCARTAEREAEKRVNALLPDYLGRAEKYETRIRGDSTGAVIRGRLERVEVTGTNVQLNPALTVDSVRLEFAEVIVDTKAKRLSSIGDAAFSCRIAASHLNHYLRTVRPDIKNLAVTFKGNELVVEARPELLNVAPLPVRIEGKLRPRAGGRLLDFDPDRGKLFILPIPEIVLDYLVKKLTPAVDLSHLTVPLHVQSAEISDGYFNLAGTIDPEDILRLAK